jgi:hypothetical protein
VLPEDGLLGPKHVASILKYKHIYFNNIKNILTNFSESNAVVLMKCYINTSSGITDGNQGLSDIRMQQVA